MSVIALVLGISLLSLAVIDYARSPADHKGIYIGDLFLPLGPQGPSAAGQKPSPNPRGHPPTPVRTPGGSTATGLSRCWAYTQAGTTTQGISRKAGALAASPCTGVSWVFHWRDLEPAPGQYRWTLVDAAIASTSKPVFLRVVAGIQSPDWVRSAALTISIPATSLTPAGWMPVPWDRRFLNQWEAFIAAFGARYDRNARIALIEVAGNGIYGESYLPGGLVLWQSVGYTQAGYIAAIKEVVNKYVAAFPHRFIGLGVSSGVVGANQNPMSQLVAWEAQVYPSKVYVQQNGLSAATVQGRQSVQRGARFGFQMVGPTNQSRTGNLCTAFRIALAERASYVEVYFSDATNPAWYPALRYLMSGNSAAHC